MFKNVLRMTLGVVSLIIAFDASGQDVNGDGLITFLVPINATSVAPGANGSTWQTQLWIHNGSTDISVAPFGCGPISPCPALIRPGETQQLLGPSSGPYIFNIEEKSAGEPLAAQVTVSGRLFELSQHAQPAGVHIPIVREAQFFSGSTRFIGIERSSTSRVAVRLYDPFRSIGTTIHLDFFDEDGKRIVSSDVSLAYSANQAEPGYAAIYDVANTFPQLSAVERFDIEVTPPSGLKYWAVVSVTDNETQQVLLVTSD